MKTPSLYIWQTINQHTPKNKEQILNEILWNNRFIERFSVKICPWILPRTIAILSAGADRPWGDIKLEWSQLKNLYPFWKQVLIFQWILPQVHNQNVIFSHIISYATQFLKNGFARLKRIYDPNAHEFRLRGKNTFKQAFLQISSSIS